MNCLQLTATAAVLCLPGLAAPPGNLMPNPEFRVGAGSTPEGWRIWSPLAVPRPAQAIVELPGGRALRVASADFASVGKWQTSGIDIQGGHYYQFEVLYRPDGLTDERGSVANLLSWNSATGEPLQRDYVDRIAPSEDGHVVDGRRGRTCPGQGRNRHG